MPDQSNPASRREFMRCCLVGAAVGPVMHGCHDPTADGVRIRGGAPIADAPSWDAIRAQFLLEDGFAYLNTAGLGPTPRPVIEAVVRCMTELEKRCETGHDCFGRARERAAAFLHCDADELALTRNTTESMNVIARGLSPKAGDEVLMTTHEHPGGSIPWFALAQDRGIVVRLFEPAPTAGETIDRLAAALTPRTRVVSVSHVTCTLGQVLPIAAIAELCRRRGIRLVVDGAQAVAMLPLDLHALGCDFYAFSGHKWLLGPKETGFLYVSRRMTDHWRPTHVGAYSDKQFDLNAGVLELLPGARSSEYGTRNAASAEGLIAAIDFVEGLGMDRVAQHGRNLARRFAELLRGLAEVEVLTPSEPASCASIVTFRFPHSHWSAWDWVEKLRTEYRIRARPVDEQGLSAIRVATHVFNTESEVDRALQALTELSQVERRSK